MNEESKKKDIRHGNASFLAAIKLKFLKKLIKQIKENKFEVMNNMQDDLSKSDPYNERQTVDVDTDVEYNPKKENKKRPAWR